MSRSNRPLAAGTTYHLTTRGNERRDIFCDDGDRRRFLARFGKEAQQRGWVVRSYCLMPNHVHLVVTTAGPDLSEGMRELLGSYARAFNDRHARAGHLFGGRFHSRVVFRDAHHVEVLRYVALNPVRAGLCEKPEAFRWSAHAALAGLRYPPSFLSLALEPFDGDRGRYARFVADGLSSGGYLEALVGDGAPERLRCAIDAGFSQAEIAAVLGRERRTVARRLNMPKGV